MAVTNYIDADSISPDLQLIDRRSAERVSGHQQRHLPRLPEPLRDLGDRGGLAYTVDAHRQDNEGLGAFCEQGLQRYSLHGRQHIEQGITQYRMDSTGL